MIERIARRAGGFASTTALRWLRAGGDAVPELAPPTHSSASGGLGRPLTKGAALVGTFAVVSSSKAVRSALATGLRKAAEKVRTDRPTRPAQARPSSANGSKTSATNGSRANGSNGTRSLSSMTRAQLYELAKAKSIPGRSSMSKQELQKALL